MCYDSWYYSVSIPCLTCGHLELTLGALLPEHPIGHRQDKPPHSILWMPIGTMVSIFDEASNYIEDSTQFEVRGVAHAKHG